MTATYLDVVFDALAGASIAGGVIALGVWALCTAFGRLPATARCTLWWLVSLKLLVGLTSIEPVAVPILPPALSATSAPAAPAVTTPLATQSIESPVASAFTWRAALVVIWLGGLVVVGAFAVRQCRRLSSVRARSLSADRGLVSLVRELSERSGLSAPPDVRLSDEVDAPLVSGLMRPVVIVPSRRWHTLTAQQQRMAICHELLHVRRRDLWLGLAPAVAERLFFFHPLARLAAREYVIAREAACDAAVLRVLDAEPHDYGRLLVTLGVAPLPDAVSASGAPHSFSSLKRRIGMLNLGAPTRAHRLAGWALAAVALAGLLPLELVARPATALVAEQEALGPKMRTAASGFEYRLVLSEKDGSFESGNFEGERDRHDRPGFWFRLGGRTYEVRDAVSIEQARAIVKPVAEIGRQQGEIGAKQGLIGAQQGIVGAKQGEVGARQGAIGAQQGLLGARQGVLGARQAADLTDAEKEQIEKELQQIDREMRALNAKMSALDKEMREVSASMPDVSFDMDKLSKQMDVLSGKMADASAKADAQLRELAEKLIKLGTAKPVK